MDINSLIELLNEEGITVFRKSDSAGYFCLKSKQTEVRNFAVEEYINPYDYYANESLHDFAEIIAAKVNDKLTMEVAKWAMTL